MKQRHAELLLAAVIIARSTSLLFSKTSLGTITPFNLLAVRFTLAFLILTLLFHKKMRTIDGKILLRGALQGGAFFLVMTTETFGLRLTDSSTTSFITNSAIVIVPFLKAVLDRHLPDKRHVIIALITLTGVGFLTLKSGSFSFGGGEAFCLLSAFLYACAIIITARLSRMGDPLILGILQVGFMGLFALTASFLFEQPRLPATPTEWGCILMLSLVCSCFGFTLQPVAQRYTTAERASQFCALSPLSATILGVIFLHEPFGIWGVVGAVLILTGILLQNIHPKHNA